MPKGDFHTRSAGTLQVQFHIPVLNPSDGAEPDSKNPSQKSRKEETDDKYHDPCARGISHGSEYADWAYQSAGSHTGAGGDVFHVKDHGGQGAGNHGDQSGANPDFGIPYNVSHLQHTGSKSLCQKAAYLVFTVAHDGKTNHLSAAACGGGSSCQPVKGQGDADGSTADGESQSDPNESGDQDSHDKGLKFRGGFDQSSKPVHEASYSRTYKLGDQNAGCNRKAGRYDNIQPGFLGDDFSKLCCHNGSDQGTYRSAQLISRNAYGGGGEEDQLGRFQRMGYRKAQGCSRGAFGIRTDNQKALDP